MFGVTVPTEYGGLGLSYASYTRAMAMVTSKDGSLAALLADPAREDEEQIAQAVDVRIPDVAGRRSRPT